MTKGVSSLACSILIASVVGTGRCATDVRPGGSASRLVGLAALQFPNLTRAERALLENADINNLDREDFAAAGTKAGSDDPSNDPAHANEWVADRNVRASLIRWLYVTPDVIKIVDPRGVRLLGARIVCALDFKDVHLPFPLVLRNCFIDQRMNFQAAKISRLDLNGSHTGEIEARGINVEGDVEVGLGFDASGEVSLLNARIGGMFNATAGHFNRSPKEIAKRDFRCRCHWTDPK